MCLICEQLPAIAPWSDPDSDSSDDDRRKQFHGQMRAMRAVAKASGVDVRSELAGSAYVVSDKKGRSAVCRSMEEVWAAIDDLSGLTPDPMDPGFLERLASM